MAFHYKPLHPVPSGLPELLMDFTREVLRNQPPNILIFGAQYFRSLLKKQTSSPFAVVCENIRQLFREADPDGIGYVKFSQFRNALLDERSGLDERLAQMTLVEQEIGDDGTCDYQDFLHILIPLLDVVSTIPIKVHSTDQPRIHIHGFIRDEYEQLVNQKLLEYECLTLDGLDRPTIRNALQDPEMGLMRKEINLVMGFIEVNYPDGQFTGENIASKITDLLWNAHEENIFAFPTDAATVNDILIHAFEDIDRANTGKLPVLSIQSGLFAADFGLTVLQTHAIVGLLADITADVDYVAFAEYIAQWVVVFLNGTDLREAEATVAGKEREQLYEYLMDIFKKADPSDTGYVTFPTLVSIVDSLPFTPRERSAILSFSLQSIGSTEGIPYDVIAEQAFNVCFVQSRLALNLVGETREE
ncbi:putative radial spoke protein 7 [Monocercomonoides exilis]|uniref:putative radial spoke protein 7 n=1 Tax=Monocercomonoides exilis TaxID=2049356 RepID=UPI00355A2D01|nr:putative radial spoke protein 7 [Monocercomonoides exilis]|eukprot:MONOS_2541.1-p1 / transcript=MONOS_2541.1 / gene=MONOS_2541 / organism=Monocercomonoides_exilis_PA203 / gene_product=radial spoke protein 7 / transcript_product=radial spoke protein 7 / location=Mono_scaffold00053:45377-47082(+) / protein_length=416 / sequence_SO=supercontig / SO=protein_coding / is_pseudo=false